MSKQRSRKKKSESKPGSRPYLIVGAVVLVLCAAAWLLFPAAKGPRASEKRKSISAGEAASSPQPQVTAKRLKYKVKNSYPHDPEAFLQGLLWHNGSFYESTGLAGRSSLRRLEPSTGRAAQIHNLAHEHFGEGLALAGNRIIQLTWLSKKGFVYDLETLRPVGEFTYDSEGWGLTYDGESLIMSDGSSTLTYLDPATFAPTKRLAVTMNGKQIDRLNELEFIGGEIWANVWQTDLIVMIDPLTGQVTSYLDLKALLPQEMRTGGEDVLNGIAFDPQKKRVFVGGKLWPRIFEIKVKKKAI